MSNIEWTDQTWNPVTGCTKVSPGCKHCYAERMAKRLKAMGQTRYHRGFKWTVHDDVISAPRRWKKPRKVFVCSMSDLFQEDVPAPVIWEIFKTMNACPQHQFQVLTKRPKRMAQLLLGRDWTPNIWAGTSVENADYVGRIKHLLEVPSVVRFLSLEPLLGPLPNLDLTGIHWVIVGGESGPGARPMDGGWAREIRDQCRAADVPFFFKQWGGVRKWEGGRKLDGRVYSECPKAPEAAAGASR